MQERTIYSEGKSPCFPTLSGDAECDVLVIGGGLCGLLCARYLTDSGANVLLCEAKRIARAVTARSTAVVSAGQDVLCRDIGMRMGDDAARLVIRARLDALDEYKRLAKEFRLKAETRDFYLYSAGSPIKLEREYDKLRRMNVEASLVKTMPLNIKISNAICFHGQLQLDPLDICTKLAKGLTIRENTRIKRITSDGALTDKYEIRARHVVVATHFPLPKLRGLFALKLYQSRSYVLALEGTGDIGGAYEDIAENGMYMRMYDKLLLLGGGDHRTGKKGEGFDPLLKFRAENFRNAKLVTSWATQDTVSLDGLPYIGRLTRRTKNIFVATGFGGYGFMGSMMSAKLIHDLIIEKPNPTEKLFAPYRSMMSGQLLANIAEAAGNYLIPTTRRCPHLGCALKWNADQCTWECGCHGSRFDKCGHLLNDPAQHDL